MNIYSYLLYLEIYILYAVVFQIVMRKKWHLQLIFQTPVGLAASCKLMNIWLFSLAYANTNSLFVAQLKKTYEYKYFLQFVLTKKLKNLKS